MHGPPAIYGRDQGMDFRLAGLDSKVCMAGLVSCRVCPGATKYRVQLVSRIRLQGLYGRVSLQGLSWGDQIQRNGQSGGTIDSVTQARTFNNKWEFPFLYGGFKPLVKWGLRGAHFSIDVETGGAHITGVPIYAYLSCTAQPR